MIALWLAFNRLILRRAPAKCYACWPLEGRKKWKPLSHKDPLYWLCDECLTVWAETNRR